MKTKEHRMRDKFLINSQIIIMLSIGEISIGHYLKRVENQ